MKLVHVVIGKANPERPNGVNRAVHGLASAQRRAGVDVEVWGLTVDARAETPSREYRLRLFRWRSLRRVDRELLRALDHADADTVFHFHGGFQPEFHACARRLAARGLPWILTPHGAYRAPNVGRSRAKKRIYLALFDAFVLRGARAVQVFSTCERDELLALEPRARAVVVPNGQEPLARPVVAPSVRTSAAPPSVARPSFGTCGRLVQHEKGLDLLIDGFALHVRAGGAGELMLVGDGPDRERLKSRALAAGVAERVRFVGELFGDAKLAQLAACDAFLQPSRTEGMPMSVLEAAALGLPCVVSRETNLGEEIERWGAGLVLERNDAEDIAAALARVATLQERGELAELGLRGRAMIDAEFAWSSVARRTLVELYGAGAIDSLR
ncbi:MAG: glycosyltransferase family 4 protein [Planctomycetes bacterium]|nr:glycosyltransferase family 4 protein [Planctomycetota bacterium]